MALEHDFKRFEGGQLDLGAIFGGLVVRLSFGGVVGRRVSD